MKRIFKVLIIILLVIVVSPVMAKEFTISDTDIKVNLDDSKWYVFTRDNIKDNKQLKEFGISEDYMNTTFTNGNIYLDAIKFKSNNEIIELFVMKKPVEKIKNMSKYSDKELQDVAKEIAKNENTSDYKIYKTDYKYVNTKYSDSGKEIIDYYTVINGYGYTIKLQSDKSFTTDEQKEMEDIIKSVSFKIDKSLKEPSKGMNKVWQDALIGAIVGGLGGATYTLVNKNKKKKNNDSKNE